MDHRGKKLLIMGATTETIKLVQLAESMGIETYVADPFENAAAKPYSSHPVNLDCFDTDAVCALVERERIDGVLPGCADVLVAAYEEVARRTGRYCYLNEQIVRVLNNKKGLKEALRKYGLPTIPEYTYEEVKDLDASQYPLFLKPVDNNSSKGMSVVYDYSGFEAAYEKALSFSRSKTVLIERKMECDDMTFGYVIQDGKIGIMHIHDRYINNEQPGVGTITAACVYPSKHKQLYMETVHEKICRMLNGLGYRNGIVNFQAFVEDNKIMLYDPAVRITGEQSYVLTDYFCGLNYMEYLINFALTGKMADHNIVDKCDVSFGGNYGCNLVFSVRPCTIGRIEGAEYARNHPNVINVTQEHFPGDVIDRVGTAQQNIFRMHLVADTKQTLASAISNLQDKVIAYDENDNDMMLTGVDPDNI